MTLNALEIAFTAASECILDQGNSHIEEIVHEYTRAGHTAYDKNHRELIGYFAHSIFDMIVYGDVSAQKIVDDIIMLKRDSATLQSMEEVQEDYWELCDLSLKGYLDTQIQSKETIEQDIVARKYEASISILDDLQPVDDGDQYSELKILAERLETLCKQTSLHQFISVGKPPAPQ